MTTPINEHNMLTLDFWRDTMRAKPFRSAPWAVRH